MGADGHTASLFPHSPALDSGGRLIVLNAGPTVTPPDRITMTFDLLNASRFIAVMVTGEKKRDMIARLAATHRTDTDNLPITGIQPLGGELRWYLDAATVPQ
jgi:6-phosphogluconolactonase/glucosamine-6-phosphate isomerase/deaminase